MKLGGTGQTRARKLRESRHVCLVQPGEVRTLIYVSEFPREGRTRQSFGLDSGSDRIFFPPGAATRFVLVLALHTQLSFGAWYIWPRRKSQLRLLRQSQRATMRRLSPPLLRIAAEASEHQHTTLCPLVEAEAGAEDGALPLLLVVLVPRLSEL